MVDCVSIHPSAPPQRACESLQTTHAWHQDIVPEDDTKIQHILGGNVCVCVFVYLGGWLSGVEGWESSLLEGKHQASNEKRVLKMVSGSQRCDWSQFDSHRLGWEGAPNRVPPLPSFCLAAWNWDRWLHSDRIIPNLVLIYTVHIIHFYNMTRKTSSKRDGLILGFRVSTGCVVVLIIPDRLYHLKATHASKWDFITASPWDFLQTQRDERLLRLTHTADELWDLTVRDTLQTERGAILNDIFPTKLMATAHPGGKEAKMSSTKSMFR